MTTSISESDIQIAIVEYLSIISRRYGFIFFSVPNEAYAIGKGRKVLTGAEYGRLERLKKMGLTPGVSDLVIVHTGRAFFMEVKKPGGKQNEGQKLFMKNAYAVGAEYAVVRSVDDVIDALKVWGIV